MGLGNFILCERFTVQTRLWSLEFVIHNKSWARLHQSLKLDSKLKNLKFDATFANITAMEDLWQGSTTMALADEKFP